MFHLEGNSHHFRAVSKSVYGPVREPACVPRATRSNLALHWWDMKLFKPCINEHLFSILLYKGTFNDMALKIKRISLSETCSLGIQLSFNQTGEADRYYLPNIEDRRGEETLLYPILVT